VKAADETDPAKKQEYLDQAKKYNDAAKKDIAKRDSVNDLAMVADINAKSRRNEANTVLNTVGTDDATAYTAVAATEVPGSTARSGGTQQGGTEPVAGGTQQGGTQQGGTQQGGTQQGGTEPIAGGTQQGGSEPVAGGTQQGGTQQGGTQQGGTQQGGTQQGGSEPIAGGTQQGGTQQGGSQQGGSEPVAGGTQPIAGGTNPSQGGSVSQRLAPGEQFVISSQPVTEPIPVNPALPEGLVYKVQVGAFRNPIPTNTFAGIQPLTSETTASGLTRYTAGLFTNFDNADAAKREIRAMGYSDAFVVAFYNGKRISIDEARRIANGGTAPVAGGTQQGGSEPVAGGTQQGGSEPVAGGTQPAVTTVVAPAADVKTVEGLFYTVQVGVYSRPVTARQLKNLNGLFVERTANGNYRYAAGKYNSKDAAIASKNNIVQLGITDAFVTAYFNGQRITLEKAAELEAGGNISKTPEVRSTQQQGGVQQGGTQQGGTQQGGTQQGGTQQGGTQQGGTQQGGTQQGGAQQGGAQQGGAQQGGTQQGGTQQGGTQPVTSESPVPDTGLVFSVQIGAFRDEVPVDIATKFLQFSSRGVKNYVDPQTGLTVYQVGVFVSKEQAEALRDEAVGKGLPDAFIVAWKNGKKISMEEAVKPQ
jgi:hypothetical protein